MRPARQRTQTLRQVVKSGCATIAWRVFPITSWPTNAAKGRRIYKGREKRNSREDEFNAGN